MIDVQGFAKGESTTEHGHATATKSEFRTCTINFPTTIELQLTLTEVRELIKGTHKDVGSITDQYAVLRALSLGLAEGFGTTVMNLSHNQTLIVRTFLENRLTALEHIRKADNECATTAEDCLFDADVYITLKLLLITIREAMIGEIVSLD